MLTSIALIFLTGLLLGSLFKKIKLPELIGMLLAGILLGPNMFNLIDTSILEISPALRQAALVIILTRAGLSLHINDLKKVGRPAIMMCFIPACFEILGMILLAPKMLHVTILEAALIGSVIAAVSPAVIVPRMLKLMKTGHGSQKSIPQLIMASSSVDDVFVIVLFTSFLSLANGESISMQHFIKIPISMILGIFIGISTGYLLSHLFKKIHMRDSVKVILLLSISFLFLTMEQYLADMIPFSGLLAIMSIGIAILHDYHALGIRMSSKFSKLWVGAEVLLFVLVGATVDIRYVLISGIHALLLLLAVLIFRVFGVFLCLLQTKLTIKERVFCMIAYLPKATVQAAIGGIPLTMGLSCGNIVLTVAVLAILITAPLGALGIDYTYEKLLTKP